MAAISQQIPNLLGGVSQQADPLKLAGQVKESINAYLDPTFGCRKSCLLYTSPSPRDS